MCIRDRSKACSVSDELHCKDGGVVENPSNRVGNNFRNRPRIRVVIQEVRRDPPGTRDRKPSEANPLSICKRSMMQSCISTTSLLASLHRELVSVRRQMPNFIKLRRGSVRYNTLSSSSLPCRHGRRKLEPRRPHLHVIWSWRACEVVDAVGDSFERPARCRQTVDRCTRNGGPFELASRDESPLRRSVMLAVECLSLIHI